MCFSFFGSFPRSFDETFLCASNTSLCRCAGVDSPHILVELLPACVATLSTSQRSYSWKQSISITQCIPRSQHPFLAFPPSDTALPRKCGQRERLLDENICLRSLKFSPQIMETRNIFICCLNTASQSPQIMRNENGKIILELTDEECIIFYPRASNICLGLSLLEQ